MLLKHLWFKLTVSYLIVDTITLLFDAVSVSRFVFIFYLKDPASFQDDFWFLYSSLVIYLFCILFWGTLHFIADFQPVVYYICTGQDSTEAIKHPFKGYGMTDLFSFFLNIFIYIKVYLYKRKTNPQPQTHRCFLKMMSLTEIENTTLANFFFVAFCLAFLFSTTVAVTKLNLISSKDFNIFPNYLLAYYRSLVAPAFCSIFFTAWFYSKKNLRQKVWDQVLDEVY